MDVSLAVCTFADLRRSIGRYMRPAITDSRRLQLELRQPRNLLFEYSRTSSKFLQRHALHASAVVSECGGWATAIPSLPHSVYTRMCQNSRIFRQTFSPVWPSYFSPIVLVESCQTVANFRRGVDCRFGEINSLTDI